MMPVVQCGCARGRGARAAFPVFRWCVPACCQASLPTQLDPMQLLSWPLHHHSCDPLIGCLWAPAFSCIAQLACDEERMGGVGNQFALTSINSFLFCLVLMFITEGHKFGTFLTLLQTNKVGDHGLAILMPVRPWRDLHHPSCLHSSGNELALM